MKKYIILTLFALCISLCVSGQIQRNFFGCTLGKSSKSQVIKILKSKGYKLTVTQDWVDLYNVTFEGVKWNICSINFTNGIFGQINFATPNRKYFRTIKTIFDKKYSDYELEHEYSGYRYSDDIVYLKLSLEDLMGVKNVYVCYDYEFDDD